MDNNPFNQQNYLQTAEFETFMQWFKDNPTQTNPTHNVNPQQFTSQNIPFYNLGDDSIHYQYEQHASTPNEGSNSMNMGVPIDDDDDVEEEVGVAQEPILQPAVNINSSQGTPQGRARLTGKRAWSKQEESVLISSYMMHCTDAVCSTNQKGADLWRKVFASYEAARAERPHEVPERTMSMMECHWRRMCGSIMKWVGCYEEASRVKRSGKSISNVKASAHALYNEVAKGQNFKYEVAWEMLEDYPKWKPRVERYLPGKGKGKGSTTNSNSSGKRMREDEDDLDTTQNVESEGGFMSGRLTRLDGVKKAKAAAKKRGKGVASAAHEVASLTTGENIQAHTEMMGVVIDLHKEKLELEKAKERRRIRQMELEERKMKIETLNALLHKSGPLDEREEKLKDCLMAEVYGM